MKKVKVDPRIACAVVLSSLAQASWAIVNHTPSQLVSMACPTEWKNIDVVIHPNDLNWANTTDRNTFLDYQDGYIMFNVTKSWGTRDQRYADDALTVASECALRKNTVVDSYFNKTIDTTTILRARINSVPILMYLLD